MHYKLWCIYTMLGNDHKTNETTAVGTQRPARQWTDCKEIIDPISTWEPPEFKVRVKDTLRLASVTVFFCGAPSLKDMFSLYAAGPRQRSLSRYLTVSDLRLSFSSTPTTRRVTMEVFEPKPHGCSSIHQIRCLL
jgi:hypothetical protein